MLVPAVLIFNTVLCSFQSVFEHWSGSSSRWHSLIAEVADDEFRDFQLAYDI